MLNITPFGGIDARPAGSADLRSSTGVPTVATPAPVGIPCGANTRISLDDRITFRD